jgi:glycosyltransferase involved in cell wall biosynthesis
MALDMRHRKALMRQSLDWPDVVLAHSRVVTEMFATAGLSRRVRHLANGHELDWVRGYRGKTPSAVLRVGYLGQLTPAKGVHLLVEAFRRAHLGERGRLEIWGDPGLEPAYAERLRDMAAGCPQVEFRGRFARGDLATVLEGTNVVAVPSTWYENAPLVIHEAFATHTPVVATRLGGMAEAVTHGIDGLLFERNDVEDLARQLRRLADESGLLSTLAAGSPAVKTVEQEVEELEDTYRGLIAGRVAFGDSVGAPSVAGGAHRGET